MSTLPTGQQIINGALTTLGILEQGGTPSVSDSTDALNELNNMWDAWAMDEGIVFAEIVELSPLNPSASSYSIGPSGDFNIQPPAKIYEAYALVNTGGTQIRREIKIVNAAQYYSHADLLAIGIVPEELYPDYNIDGSGLAHAFVWPAGTASPANIEIRVAVNFTAWQLSVTYTLPFGFQDALNYALAYRLIPRYGLSVAPQTVEMVTNLAEKAELRIRKMNKFNRQLPEGQEMLVQPPPAVPVER
jgi:hypothetical protein